MFSHIFESNVVFSDQSELMVTMGFPKDEITESLQNQKYDEVMATYLLLGRKAPEVSFLQLLVITALDHALSSSAVVLLCCSLRAASR